MSTSPDALTHVPPGVLGRVQRALQTLHRWNDAIRTARRMETLAGCPGRYEHDLRYLPMTGGCQRDQVVQAETTLATFETQAVAHGIAPEAVYQALGGKPVLLPEGPHVQEWHPRTTTEPAA